ncbi:hypothetical protein IJ732_07570 [bacterium]|nr:hypothetical protein [bacterium]
MKKLFTLIILGLCILLFPACTYSKEAENDIEYDMGTFISGKIPQLNYWTERIYYPYQEDKALVFKLYTPAYHNDIKRIDYIIFDSKTGKIIKTGIVNEKELDYYRFFNIKTIQLKNGDILFFEADENYVNLYVYIFSLKDFKVHDVGTYNLEKSRLSLYQISDDEIFIIGGDVNRERYVPKGNDVYILNLKTKQIKKIYSLKSYRYYLPKIKPYKDDKLLLVAKGGINFPYKHFSIFDIKTNSFKELLSVPIVESSEIKDFFIHNDTLVLEEQFEAYNVCSNEYRLRLYDIPTMKEIGFINLNDFFPHEIYNRIVQLPNGNLLIAGGEYNRGIFFNFGKQKIFIFDIDRQKLIPVKNKLKINIHFKDLILLNNGNVLMLDF